MNVSLKIIKTSFLENRCSIDGIPQEEDTNSKTGKQGIRCYSLFTALFLMIFGLVKRVADENGNIFYLNKKSYAKWKEMHVKKIAPGSFIYKEVLSKPEQIACYYTNSSPKNPGSHPNGPSPAEDDDEDYQIFKRQFAERLKEQADSFLEGSRIDPQNLTLLEEKINELSNRILGELHPVVNSSLNDINLGGLSEDDQKKLQSTKNKLKNILSDLERELNEIKELSLNIEKSQNNEQIDEFVEGLIESVKNFDSNKSNNNQKMSGIDQGIDELENLESQLTNSNTNWATS